MKRALIVAAGVMIASPALAEDRPLCPDRPGLGTPACTVAPGKLLVETALADWTRDDEPGARTDTVLIGDTVARFGIAPAAEIEFGWTPFGHQRTRDGGTIDRADRIGDVTLGAKINLAHPDGTHFAIALQPLVTLPVGRTPIGAVDWSATLAVPMTYEMSDTLSLEALPAVSAATDEDGHGRHFAIGSVFGIGVSFSDTVTTAIEAQVTRDDDPAGATTQMLAGLAVAWQPTDRLQLDIGTSAGLNHDTPDARLYVGIARLF